MRIVAGTCLIRHVPFSPIYRQEGLHNLVAQDDAEAASAQRLLVADQLRTKVPKLAAFMDEAEHDVLA